MMSYKDWLARIIQAARDIASREFQQQAWFYVGGNVRSSPDEVYLTLMEDCTFDLFLSTYKDQFTEEQKKSAYHLKSSLEKYYDSLPQDPDPRQVLDDPAWERIRQSAKAFLEAFGEQVGSPPLYG